MTSHVSSDHHATMSGRWEDNEQGKKELAEVGLNGVPSHEHGVVTETLARKLSARQVQMIAIGGKYRESFAGSIAATKTYLSTGTIGTGLFLGTGKSLATGGPASMLISYAIVGAIVFITMLSLGEMAAFVPVAGSFCTFAG